MEQGVVLSFLAFILEMACFSLSCIFAKGISGPNNAGRAKLLYAFAILTNIFAVCALAIPVLSIIHSPSLLTSLDSMVASMMTLAILVPIILGMLVKEKYQKVTSKY